MILSIHTVFILRENILFLEEWIIYHISIGFSKFYLYDNSNSVGNEGSTTELNRYKIDFASITKHISDKKLNEIFYEILTKYRKYVVTIKWEPKDAGGNIIYGQRDSIIDYITKYSDESHWTAFIDMDEFIYSREKLNYYINVFDDNEIGDITLLQKKFDDRFNNLGKPVTEIMDCIDGLDTLGWGPKHIVKNSCFFLDEIDYWNIHSIPTRNCKCIIADSKLIRFNHYNLNDTQLRWMKCFYGNEVEFLVNSKCDELYSNARHLDLKDCLYIFYTL